MITDITAPLVSGAPQALDVSIPCRTIATLPAGGRPGLLHHPARRHRCHHATGCSSRANADVVVRRVPRLGGRGGAHGPPWHPARCSTLHVWANVGGVGADFVGIPGATGTLAPEKKPQVAGVFTDLKVAAQPGLSARIDVDTRFITTPTALKLGVMVLGVICVVASIVALAVLDRRTSGRRRTAGRGPRFIRLATVLRAGGPTLDVALIADIGVDRHLAALACHRRHLVRRRLQPDHRQGRRATPDTRPTTTASSAQPRRRSTGTSSVLAHMAAISTARRVDAAARHRGGDRNLADHQPLRAAAARQAAGEQPGRGLDGGRGVPGRVAAVQQRPAAGAAHRVRRARGVGAGGERHRHPPAVARRGRDHRGGLQRDDSRRRG